MNSITTALSLEDMLGMARQVKSWSSSNNYSRDYFHYEGFFRPRLGIATVKIKVTNSKTGMHPYYRATLTYKNKDIAQLSGDEAKQLYDVADAYNTEAKKRQAEMKQKLDDAEQKRVQKTIQGLKGRLR